MWGGTFTKNYLRDDIGDNISRKNKYFCELTGYYWLWKNATEQADEVIGIVHYRRGFSSFLNGLMSIILRKSFVPLKKSEIDKYLEKMILYCLLSMYFQIRFMSNTLKRMLLVMLIQLGTLFQIFTRNIYKVLTLFLMATHYLPEIYSLPKEINLINIANGYFRYCLNLKKPTILGNIIVNTINAFMDF